MQRLGPTRPAGCARPAWRRRRWPPLQQTAWFTCAAVYLTAEVSKVAIVFVFLVAFVNQGTLLVWYGTNPEINRHDRDTHPQDHSRTRG